MSAPTCPKCSIALQEGYLLDQSRNSRAVTQWIEGKPEASFWSGLKLSGKTRLKVASFRCPRCGYLEQYAPPAGETR